MAEKEPSFISLSSRITRLEKNHKQYLTSVQGLIIHFDKRLNEVADALRSYSNIKEDVEKLYISMTQIDQVIRQGNGTPSILTRVRNLEEWFTQVKLKTTDQQLQKQKMLFEILKWSILALLGGLCGVLGRQWHLW